MPIRSHLTLRLYDFISSNYFNKHDSEEMKQMYMLAI